MFLFNKITQLLYYGYQSTIFTDIQLTPILQQWNFFKNKNFKVYCNFYTSEGNNDRFDAIPVCKAGNVSILVAGHGEEDLKKFYFS